MFMLALALGVAAQPVEWRPGLYAFTAGGTILELDRLTGAATVLGELGHPVGGASVDWTGRIYTLGDDDLLVRLDPGLRSGTVVARIGGRPPGHAVVGLAVRDGWPEPESVFVILSPPIGDDGFYSAQLPNGTYTLIGSTGQPDLEAVEGEGTTWAMSAHGVLFEILTSTGQAFQFGQPLPVSDIGGFGLTYCDGMVVYSVGTDLWLTNEQIPRRVGPTGAPDITALAFREPCARADCDTWNHGCFIDIFDFLCFQNRFSAGHAYACNADTSTGPGVCDIFDFLAFQNAYQWCNDL